MDYKQFLLDLQLMIAEKNTDGTFGENLSGWPQVPEKYQEDFQSWCMEYKQQSWEGMWEIGWLDYAHEYLAMLITRYLEENKVEEPHD